MSIDIRNVAKQFGNFQALRDVSLNIQSGELVALLGPSGCGKTTLLRIIAGLETPDSGSILFSGEDTTDVHVRERQVGFVFQHYALFRHMTVFENIAFGLRIKPRSQRPPEAGIKQKVMALLTLVQLDWLADRYPSQLSGGQRQRIALARALAVEPKVLLLDEPFGALDAKVRKELRRWLRRLHDDLHVTSIFVTHDQEEALEVSDRVVLMNHGAVEQVGSPQEVWMHPASPFVYGFLGDANQFHARAHQGQVHIGHGENDIRLDAPEHRHAHNSPALAYVRPHELDVHRYVTDSSGTGDGLKGITAKFERAMVMGPIARLELIADGDAINTTNEIIEAHISSEHFDRLRLHKGERLILRPRAARAFVSDQTALQNISL